MRIQIGLFLCWARATEGRGAKGESRRGRLAVLVLRRRVQGERASRAGAAQLGSRVSGRIGITLSGATSLAAARGLALDRGCSFELVAVELERVVARARLRLVAARRAAAGPRLIHMRWAARGMLVATRLREARAHLGQAPEQIERAVRAPQKDGVDEQRRVGRGRAARVTRIESRRARATGLMLTEERLFFSIRLATGSWSRPLAMRLGGARVRLAVATTAHGAARGAAVGGRAGEIRDGIFVLFVRGFVEAVAFAIVAGARRALELVEEHDWLLAARRAARFTRCLASAGAR